MARSIFGIGSAMAAASSLASAASAAKKKNNSSSSSSSKPTSGSSSSASSKPTSSSTTSSATSNSTPDWLKTAQANSQAWHSADAATRKNLEAQNQKLYSDHGYTYDSKTGKWSAPTSGSSSSGLGLANGAAGAAGSTIAAGLNALQSTKNKYANTDYSRVLADQMASGANWQDVQQSLNDRQNKIALSGGSLNQYANDQTMINAQSYINNMKNIEQQYQAELDRQDELKQQQQAYYDAMADQINQQYSSMLPTLNQSYDDAARQAYINYRTAQRDLPEQLAAAGISGQGASESSLVAQNNAYNQAYNQNEMARANALQSVENNRASALAGNSTQAAQSMAELANSLYQQRQSILAQQEQAKQNVINNLLNYGTATGNIGVNQTLDAQQALANIAYNKQQLAQDQSQFEQNLAYNKTNADRDYWLQRWQAQGTRGADAQIAAVLGIPVGSVYAPGSYNPNYY